MGSGLTDTTPPAAGKPTQDMHPLVDEVASVDRPLELKYVSSPTHLNNVGKLSRYITSH